MSDSTSTNKPYLHGHHASVLRSHSWRTVENSAPHLLPYLDASRALQVLDVGCGPGTISVDIASRIPHGHVIAIDPSSDVIAKARAHAKEKGITNIRFEVGDIFNAEQLESLGIKQGMFDIVHAHQVLQHLQDPLSAFKAMLSLTKKPGGIITLRETDYQGMRWYPELPGLQRWSDNYVAVARAIRCDPNIGKRLHAIAMEAGIPRKDIETSAGTWVFSTEEERRWWCGLWAERVVASDFKKRCLDTGVGTEGDLREFAEAWKELERCEEGWFAVVNGQVVVHVR
jgi:SAM-dependent methyltransferase